MEDWRSAFAEEWDAVVLGTGMKECLLSGLLSVAGKKVLHVDRNNYYGGASASLDIQQLFSKFAGAEEPSAPAHPPPCAPPAAAAVLCQGRLSTGPGPVPSQPSPPQVRRSSASCGTTP